MALLIPIVITLAGYILLHYPPQYKDSLFGYRTIASMRSRSNWDLAQQTAGDLFWKMGWIDLLICAILTVVFIRLKDPTLIVYGTLFLMVAQIIPLCITIFVVERKLKEHETTSTS